MNAFTQKITEQTEIIKVVQLAHLFLSPLNPRQTVDDEDLSSLATSIKAVGLLQNLVGIETKGKTGRVEIVAGGRRLAALKKLADSGAITDKTEVLVRIAQDEEDALICAATENDARQNLSPAQEVRAYRAMRDAEMNAEQIAKANAQSLRHVKGRLRLATLPDCILNALDKGEITLDTAAAYTVSDNQEQQERVFLALNENRWDRDNAYTIKQNLMNEIPAEDDSRAKFVTRETYEQAGGAIREDLFQEDAYFLNPELLTKLAKEKMDALVQETKAEGWKWVRGYIAPKNWELVESMEHVQPVSTPLSKDEWNRIDTLSTLELNEEANDEQIAELEALRELQKPKHAKEQRAVSGVIIYLDGRGNPDFVKGQIDKDDIEEAVEAGVLEIHKPSKKGSLSDNDQAYSQALSADLEVIHTGAFQSALLDNPKYALDLAIFTLAFPSYCGSGMVHMGAQMIKNQVEDHGQNLTDELASDHRPHLNQTECFTAFQNFKKLSDKQKFMMLADTVAKATRAPLIHEDCQDHVMRTIAKDLSVNPRDTWTPNTTFFKRMKSAQLDDVMAYVLGKPPAASFTGCTKTDKVARLHAIFNNEVDRRGFSQDEQQRIADWIPEGFIQEETNITPLPKKARSNRKTTTKKKVA